MRTAARPVDPTAAEDPSAQRAFVRLAITLTALLVIAMVALLYYRWVVAQEPNAELVVVGTPAHEGMVITVSGIELDKPYQSTLTAEHAHRAPFFLNRGLYRIRIERGGVVLNEHSFSIEPKTRLTFKLADLGASATRPGTTAPAGTPLPPRSSPMP